MGFFSKAFKTALTAIETPVAVVKDVVTFGGVLNDSGKTYTEKELKKDYKKMKDSL